MRPLDGGRLPHPFGVLYRLYLCLFISFKFIKIFIENSSRLRGDRGEQDRRSPRSPEARILQETGCEHRNEQRPFRRHAAIGKHNVG